MSDNRSLDMNFGSYPLCVLFPFMCYDCYLFEKFFQFDNEFG